MIKSNLLGWPKIFLSHLNSRERFIVIMMETETGWSGFFCFLFFSPKLYLWGVARILRRAKNILLQLEFQGNVHYDNDGNRDRQEYVFCFGFFLGFFKTIYLGNDTYLKKGQNYSPPT